MTNQRLHLKVGNNASTEPTSSLMNLSFEKLHPCIPISTTIKILENLGFAIKEQKLANHHFNELYFQMSGDISKISGKTFVGMHQVKNNLICDCHWSTIELIEK